MARKIPVVDVSSLAAHEKILKEAGITTSAGFLEAASTSVLRRSLSDKTGIRLNEIDILASICDLLRVAGVGPEKAEMLVYSGIPTVQSLRDMTPASVSGLLKKNKVAGRKPTKAQVGRYIASAKKLDDVLVFGADPASPDYVAVSKKSRLSSGRGHSGISGLLVFLVILLVLDLLAIGFVIFLMVVGLIFP